jgi:hypothetical protein
MSKQTTVEWLIDMLITENEVTLKGENFKLFEMAKAMEKEQIILAHNDFSENKLKNKMSNKKITAIEWLIVVLDIDTNDSATKEFIDQAKAMEKEQIMMAVKDSWYMAKGSNFQEPQEEQYYNQTYKGEEQ